MGSVQDMVWIVICRSAHHSCQRLVLKWVDENNPYSDKE